MQSRKGIEMTDEEKAEWQKAFTDIEESIDSLYGEEEKQKLKYLRMKQQELFQGVKNDCFENRAGFVSVSFCVVMVYNNYINRNCNRNKNEQGGEKKWI